MNNTAKTSPKDLVKWQVALNSTYRLIITLTLTKNTQLVPWLHPGPTGWVYSPSQDHILKKRERVDILSTTPTKKRKIKSLTFHQNREKIYSLAPQRLTKDQKIKNKKVYSQMIWHRPHKYSQTPMGRTSDMANIISTK